MGATRPRQPLVGIVCAAALGIVLAEFSPWPAWVFCAAALLMGLALLWVSSPQGVHLLTIVVFCGLHRLEVESPASELSRMLESKPSVVRATGWVSEEPKRAAKGSSTFRFELQRLTLGTSAYRLRAKVLVYWKGPPPECGDLVELLAGASNVMPACNPGEFDRKNQLRREGIYSQLTMRYQRDGKVHHASGAIQRFALKCRNCMERILSYDLDETTAALITSMVLGAGERTPQEMLELFRRTGTIHLFAVSGLNVAMFAVILWAVLKPWGVSRRHVAPVLGCALFFYALITGLTASGLRAALMGALALTGFCLDRRVLLPNVAAGSALLLLLVDTKALFAPGFQFSYAVVGALIYFAHPFQQVLLARLGPDPLVPAQLRGLKERCLGWAGSKLASLLAVSVVAWCAVLPFSLYYFHLVVPVAILANLLVVPMAFLVLALGMLSICSSALSTSLAAIFNNANWGAAQCLLQVVRFSAALPGSCFYLASPGLHDPVGELVVFDLGAGGATYIACDSGKWLLDCGTQKDAQRIIIPALRQRGVARLEGLLLTHGDSAHLGGAMEIVEEFAPAEVAVPSLSDRSFVRRGVEEQLCLRGVPKTLLSAGDRVKPHWQVLYPPRSIQARIADDQALVLQLQIAGVRILCMSDAGFSAEQWLLENVRDLQSDLLIRGKHVRDVEWSPDFIARVSPRVVISVADRFGAKQEMAQKLAANGVLFLDQQETGAVVITTEKEVFTVRPFLKPDEVYTFRSRAR